MNTSTNQSSTPDHEAVVITDALKEQILEVRDTGRTSMFLLSSVQRIANDLELYDLVVFLENRANRKAYLEFIISGKR